MSHHENDITAGDDGSEVLIDKELNESTHHAVLRGIATLKGTAETDLDTLYGSIEPEALETLIQHSKRHDCYVGIEFTFEGYTVLVRGEEMIKISESAPVTELEAKRGT